MKKFTLDTNLYIRAIRETAATADLQTFYSTFAPVTYLSSIVLHGRFTAARPD